MDTELREIRERLAATEAALERAKAGQAKAEAGQAKAEAGQAKAEAARAEAEAARAEAEAAQAEVEQRIEKQTLRQFLRSCHRMNTRIRPVATPTRVTTGPATNPVSRLYPQHILPWETFAEQQKQVWDLYDERLWDTPKYYSREGMDTTEALVADIGSEKDLLKMEYITVEWPANMMLDAVTQDKTLSSTPLPTGHVSFASSEAFRDAASGSVQARASGSNLDGDQAPRNARADQFCVSWKEDGSARPLIAVEYKPPHKLNIEEICLGLQSSIHTDQDIIQRDDDDSNEYRCRRLLAAVVTQLFSYMVDQGVRHGYISTGQVFVFVYIDREDPTTVYYNVNIPTRDWDADEDNQLQRTAVAQVFAFIHQALFDETPPDQDWSRWARGQLKRWQVEYIDVLRLIPASVRKSRDTSSYRPSKWASKSTRQSPIALRSQHPGIPPTPRRDEHDSENEGGPMMPASPTPQRRSRAGTGQAKRARRDSRPDDGTGRVPVRKRPYCTHECLLGLCEGRPVDRSCPNSADHGNEHMSPRALADAVRTLLDTLSDEKATCCPLYIHGARGALLKICVASHGYTFVAKGVVASDERYVRHEASVYDHLRPLQGQLVPVCCGVVHLGVPYWYAGSPLTFLLLMSWAGRSVPDLSPDDYEECVRLSGRCRLLLDNAFRRIQQHGVIHGDVATRNAVYDEQADRLMIVDFERSEISRRSILGELSANRKRQVGHSQPDRRRRDRTKHENSSDLAE